MVVQFSTLGDMTEQRWQRITYWPLVIASLAFLVAYSWQVIANLQGAEYVVMRTVMALTWVIFAVDYLVRLALAPRKAVEACGDTPPADPGDDRDPEDVQG